MRIISLNITPKFCDIFTPLNMLLKVALAQKSSFAVHISVQVMVFPSLAAAYDRASPNPEGILFSVEV